MLFGGCRRRGCTRPQGRRRCAAPLTLWQLYDDAMAGSEGSSYAPLDVRDAMSSPMLRGGGGATFGSDGEKGRVAAAPAPVRHQRVLSAWGVASLAFFITCAGPYGIEAAVTAAGPLITLIGTALMPFVRCSEQRCAALSHRTPPACVSVNCGRFSRPSDLGSADGLLHRRAELQYVPPELNAARRRALTPSPRPRPTVISENGGYILWVQDAFGPFVGWINGWSCLVANVIDLPVYLVLGADYINAYLSSGGGAGLSLMHRSLLQGAVLLLTAAFNLRGLEVVDKVSMVFALAVCLPFVIMPIVLAARSEFHASLAFAAPPDEIDWATFLNTIGWAWMGWDALGCIAGEVDDPGTSYPKGVIITAVANAFVYALPIITAVSLIPDPDHWHTATFTDAGQAVGAWLGIMVVISGLFSSKLSSTALLCASLTSLAVLVPDMGIYQASLATSSRGATRTIPIASCMP